MKTHEGQESMGFCCIYAWNGSSMRMRSMVKRRSTSYEFSSIFITFHSLASLERSCLRQDIIILAQLGWPVL